MKWCQARDTTVSDAKAETGVKSRMRSTISGGRTVSGSATGPFKAGSRLVKTDIGS